ncbi:MAG: hypothetical protein K1X94_20795 [Sandaracinaceae bacterium]|nr:hypothetical protein [Sandaracinaceae bacterium]
MRSRRSLPSFVRPVLGPVLGASTSVALASLGAVALGASGCGSTPAPDDAAVTIDAAMELDAPAPSDDAASDAGVVPGTLMIGPAERPARMIVPPQHDGVSALPIVILLHGYGASASLQDAYFATTRLSRELGFYLVLPDGTMDSGGSRFWNAGGCCDFGGADVDDVAYLTALLDDAEARVPVDAGRVYFLGHSNGAFMSYRMACVLSERITAVAALAGTEATMVACEPTRPVSVLHMHGTADTTIPYVGGMLGTVPYRGAEDEVAQWRMRDGCDESTVDGGAREYDAMVAGEESHVTTWPACSAGTTVELWRMDGSGHIPSLGGASGAPHAILEWLLARRRT